MIIDLKKNKIMIYKINFKSKIRFLGFEIFFKK